MHYLDPRLGRVFHLVWTILIKKKKHLIFIYLAVPFTNTTSLVSSVKLNKKGNCGKYYSLGSQLKDLITCGSYLQVVESLTIQLKDLIVDSSYLQASESIRI